MANTRHSMLLLLGLLLTFTVGAYSDVFSRDRVNNQYPEENIKIGLQYSSVRENEEGKSQPSISDQLLNVAEEEGCAQEGSFMTCRGKSVKSVPQNLTGNIRFLKFTGTGIRTLPDEIFQVYTNLTWIKFIENRLSGISKGAFRGISKLTILDFLGNGLVDTSFGNETFEGLCSLTSLKIQKNNLTKLPKVLLANTTKLKELYLDENKLTLNDTSAFQQLPKLTTLILNENELTSIDTSAFLQLPNLSSLSLRKNKLTYLDGDAFMNKTSLQKLDIAGNPLMCDCHASWMVNAIEKGKPWTNNWDTGLSKVYCGSPKWMSEKLIKHLYPQDLTCDKPEIQPRTETDVNHEWDTSLVLEALMVGGYPYSMWVFPDGSTIKGTLDVQKQTKRYLKSAKDSVINSDHSVIAKLIVQRFDMIGRVNFTLVATNIAGSSNLTFWVNSGVVGGAPASTVTLLMMLMSTIFITG